MSPRLRLTSRLVAAIIGGYAFAASLVFLMPLLFAAIGLARAEAVALASMLGFIIYLPILLWGFYTRHLARLWSVAGVAIVFYGWVVLGYGK